MRSEQEMSKLHRRLEMLLAEKEQMVKDMERRLGSQVQTLSLIHI